MGMNDSYAKVFDEIVKAINEHGKMVLWLAERTLSVKDYKEFINEFTKHDEPIDFLKEEGL